MCGQVRTAHPSTVASPARPVTARGEFGGDGERRRTRPGPVVRTSTPGACRRSGRVPRRSPDRPVRPAPRCARGTSAP
ncbi:hypothetical protein ACFFX0_08180 [Citricoccus parietis]|uniref:Uncharacterized protein n=1 Tax=Citricoccus parietis TaxID=592307 RepID=A0ABV5FY58_9MICC